MNEYGRYRGTKIKKESFADPSNSSCGIICTEDRTLRFRGSTPPEIEQTREYRTIVAQRTVLGCGWIGQSVCLRQKMYVYIVVQPGNKIPPHNPACRSSSRGTWYQSFVCLSLPGVWCNACMVPCGNMYAIRNSIHYRRQGSQFI